MNVFVKCKDELKWAFKKNHQGGDFFVVVDDDHKANNQITSFFFLALSDCNYVGKGSFGQVLVSVFPVRNVLQI